MNTSHYPSLELCKKLTEIGFPETEKYYWVKDNGEHHIFTMPYYNPLEEKVIAPSVMEMLDVIPQRFDDTWWFQIGTETDEGGKYFLVRYSHFYDENNLMKGKSEVNGPPKDGISCNEYNLANALAEMILWLHENKFISFNQ